MKKLRAVFLVFLFALTSCALGMAQIPSSNHVFVVMEQNHSDSSVIGNSAMPYLNSLASQYGPALNYYGKTNSSMGNYFMLMTGQTITDDDNYMSMVGADNIVRHLLSAGKTWKSYAEDLPSVGYTGGNMGGYVRSHNPFSYFSDVVNSSVQKQNLVPITELSGDLQNGTLPNLSFIVPDVYNDGENGSLEQVDSWLKTRLAPLISSPVFKQDGILFIVFDESDASDKTSGGGHVLVVVVSPRAQAGYSDSTIYQPWSMLKSILTALGVSTFPGAAASAPSMTGMLANGRSDAAVCLQAPCPVGPLKGCVYSRNGNKYQAVEFKMNYYACVPFDAKLYSGSDCTPQNQEDEFGYGQKLCLGGGWIFWFTDFPNQLNTSALWTVGNQKSCFNYSAAPGC
jgi:hypothetical protein